MPKREELSPEQKTQKQIDAMGDSVDLINNLINEGKHTQQVHDTIDRNVRHLEIMLDKDSIKNSGTSLKSFKDAIKSGTNYIKEPVVSE